MPQKVILDVDTGTDDAVALMCAALHPGWKLVAATTVNGNVEVEYCTENSLRVFDHIGMQVPVYEGMASPAGRCDSPDPAQRDGGSFGARALSGHPGQPVEKSRIATPSISWWTTISRPPDRTRFWSRPGR